MGKDSEADIGSWGFFNEPKELVKEDYKEAIGKIVSRYEKNQEIAAIYDWGSPSNPGISDLDIVFVMQDGAKSPLPLMHRSFMLLDEKTRYIARHPFMFIEERDFQDIRHIYPSGNLRKVFGRTIGQNRLKKDEEEVLQRAVLTDIIIRHYPRDFLGQQLQRKVNVRDSMLRLNSLKYTFETLRLLSGNKNKEHQRFASEVSCLRKEWFQSPDPGRLVALCDYALTEIMDIIEKSRKLSLGSSWLKKLPDDIRYFGIKNSAHFIKDWEKEKAFSQMKQIFRASGRHTSVLPMELAPLILHYASQKGGISAHIRENLDPFYNLSFDGKAISRRIQILNNQAELARRLRHSDFPAFFDFGYRNMSGINNLALRILDRIRF